MYRGPSFRPFLVARRRALESMHASGGPWKLVWLLPLNVSVLVAVHGHPVRVALQLITLGCVVLMMSRKPSTASMPFGLTISGLHYMLALSSTGGLASPLLVAGIPMAAIAGLALDTPRQKISFACAFMAVFIGLGALSYTPLVLRPSLLFTAEGPSAFYYGASTVACMLTAVGLVHLGMRVTRIYAEVAYELAARQEEICEESEEMGRSLEAIAARVAHEVKNPLASIKALSTLEAKRAQSPETAERLQVIAREADRLKEVVDGFASFTKGTGDLKLAPLRPHAIAREIAVLVEARAAESGVTVQVVGDESLEVIADGKKLRQALLNILLNAIQASPAKSAVRVAVDRDGDTARVRVIDKGEGMTASVLDRVKRPYFSTREGGSGLGLAVARGILEQHGGDLELESCGKGRGTTATLRLPLEAKEKLCVLPQPRPERAW